MKKILAAAVTLLAVAACAPEEPVDMTADAEAKLATVVAGRQAGDDVSCVNLLNVRGNKSVGEGVIVFEGAGDTLWVNRPRTGCPELRFGRALKTRTSTSQLCRGDIAVVFDPVAGIEYGGCSLGSFTPYKKVG